MGPKLSNALKGFRAVRHDSGGKAVLVEQFTENRCAIGVVVND